MNTPSNAGKEHNPWDRKPHEYGAPEWRLLNTDEAVQIGDECNYKDYRCEPRWVAVEHAGYLPISHTEYRRRTTPPTQSQVGETPETDAVSMDSWMPDVVLAPLEFTKSLERRLTAAQRENDRLAGEVAGLKADKERLDWLLNLICRDGTNGLLNFAWTMVDDDPAREPDEEPEDDPERLSPILDRAAIDKARAATEETSRFRSA